MDTNATTAQPNTQQPKPADTKPSPQTPPAKPINPLIYIAGVIIVVAIIAGFLLVNNHPSSSKTTISGQLTAQQRQFISDLQKPSGASQLGIRYMVFNFSNQTIPFGNSTAEASGSETVYAEQSGSNVRAILNDSVFYNDLPNNAMPYANITRLYYYNTSSTTVTCLNQTIGNGNVPKTTLNCTRGSGIYHYLIAFPFTLTNVSQFIRMAQLSNVSYKGSTSIAGRNCDNFTFMAFQPGSTANFSLTSICLDSQYGIPLYYNVAYFVEGLQVQSQGITATRVSLSVPNSDFTIPQVYINATKK